MEWHWNLISIRAFLSLFIHCLNQMSLKAFPIPRSFLLNASYLQIESIKSTLVSAINFHIFNLLLIVSYPFLFHYNSFFRLVVWCLWPLQSEWNVLHCWTKPRKTERDKVALLQRAQLLLTFYNDDDSTFGLLKA